MISSVTARPARTTGRRKRLAIRIAGSAMKNSSGDCGPPEVAAPHEAKNAVERKDAAT